MPPLPVVFIIEDDADCQRLYAMELEERVTIISAESLAEANSKWEQNNEKVALVVVDACVDNRNYPDSQPFIRKIRETFSGPIIAASSSSVFRQDLLQAGCSHEARKVEAPAKVLDLLGLTPIAN